MHYHTLKASISIPATLASLSLNSEFPTYVRDDRPKDGKSIARDRAKKHIRSGIPILE
jgi:hypothetical protein